MTKAKRDRIEANIRTAHAIGPTYTDLKRNPGRLNGSGRLKVYWQPFPTYRTRTP